MRFFSLNTIIITFTDTTSSGAG
ncbi:thr operon leader peptide [Acerihabitans sp. TG2]